MKKSKLIVLTIICMIIQGVAFGNEVQPEELMDMIKKLQEQVTSQQEEIQGLKKKLDKDDESSLAAEQGTQNEKDQPSVSNVELGQDSLAPSTDNADSDETIFQQGYPLIKEVLGVEFNKGIDGLTLKGDARFRYERQERELFLDEDKDDKADDLDGDGTPDRKEQARDRQRVRLRIGGIWHNFDDSWEFGVGIATGGAESTSTNDTFSDNDVFESGDLRLDYAYARHSWEYIDLVIGQQKNPWKDTTTFIMWDGDVRPIGITGKTNMEGFFAAGGVYDVFHFGRDEANAILFAGQAGYQLDIEEEMSFLFALGFWYFNNPTGDLVPVHSDYDYTIGDVYSHFQSNFGDLRLKVYGHVAQNFGADGPIGGGQIETLVVQPLKPEDEDLAWLLGIKSKYDSVELDIAYAHIEADSVFAELKDSDFGDTGGLTDTDVKGIKISMKYGFTKTISLKGTFMDLSEIEGDKRDGELFQLDLVYKF